MFGILEADEIDELLKNQIVGRIGCHADGLTYIVPISYAYDGDSVFMHTHEGRKVNIMRKNPSVCFEVEEMVNMANWKSVIAWGTFQEITDHEERNHALTQLSQRIFPLIASKTVHLSDTWPFESDDFPFAGGIVCKIRVTEKTGRFENEQL